MHSIVRAVSWRDFVCECARCGMRGSVAQIRGAVGRIAYIRMRPRRDILRHRATVHRAIKIENQDFGVFWLLVVKIVCTLWNFGIIFTFLITVFTFLITVFEFFPKCR